jgi:hypothetical protein
MRRRVWYQVNRIVTGRHQPVNSQGTRMATAISIRANRSNAQKSTGPRGAGGARAGATQAWGGGKMPAAGWSDADRMSATRMPYSSSVLHRSNIPVFHPSRVPRRSFRAKRTQFVPAARKVRFPCPAGRETFAQNEPNLLRRPGKADLLVPPVEELSCRTNPICSRGERRTSFFWSGSYAGIDGNRH